MLISAALLAASLSAAQDEALTLPDMPDIDTATQEQIDTYLGFLQSSLQQIDDVDSFGANWSRFITEVAELTSHYRVRDPYALTAELTRIYDDAEEAMPGTGGEYEWALGLDFDMSRHETTSDDGASSGEAGLPPLPEYFCETGELTVIAEADAPYGRRLDLCLAYGPDPEGDGYYFAEAQIIHRYVYTLPNGHGNGYYDIHAAASMSDERGLNSMQLATRDLAEAIANQILLRPELVGAVE
ncbi:hypothetical protein [Hyphobacterium sp.]|uniref:hypothetical protein n=1 Tax=Hyphobacterium sp. TaxID=2004662 RepID=UPI00374A44AE